MDRRLPSDRTNRQRTLSVEDLALLQAVADTGCIGLAAERVCCSRRTAYRRLERVQQALGTRTLLETIIVAFRQGLVH
ncbi:MAG: LysR family transcriptional regulator [Fimbriimonadales bacterium]|nr:MAG: hypothetical protein KatS3mg018_1661 [Fimbriimonadales bacterium]